MLLSITFHSLPQVDGSVIPILLNYKPLFSCWESSSFFVVPSSIISQIRSSIISQLGMTMGCFWISARHNGGFEI